MELFFSTKSVQFLIYHFLIYRIQYQLYFNLFHHLTRFSFSSTNFISTLLPTFSRVSKHKMKRPYFWKTLSKYQFLAALFSVVLSNYSFQHGRCWKLNFWCISDTFISKLREKIRFLYHRNYSTASILLKLSTMQRARKSNFKFYFLHCRPSQLSQFLITDIITTRAIDRKSFWAHCNKLIRGKPSRRLHFFEVPGRFLFTSEYRFWNFFSY